MLEGVFTILFDLFAFWALPNTPLEVKTLSATEREYCLRRLELDERKEKTKIVWTEVLRILPDLILWVLILVLFCNGVSLFGPRVLHAQYRRWFRIFAQQNSALHGATIRRCVRLHSDRRVDIR